MAVEIQHRYDGSLIKTPFNMKFRYLLIPFPHRTGYKTCFTCYRNLCSSTDGCLLRLSVLCQKQVVAIPSIYLSVQYLDRGCITNGPYKSNLNTYM